MEMNLRSISRNIRSIFEILVISLALALIYTNYRTQTDMKAITNSMKELTAIMERQHRERLNRMDQMENHLHRYEGGK